MKKNCTHLLLNDLSHSTMTPNLSVHYHMYRFEYERIGYSIVYYLQCRCAYLKTGKNSSKF